MAEEAPQPTDRDEAETPNPPATPPEDNGPVNQADIDALLASAGGAADSDAAPAEAPAKAPPPPSADAAPPPEAAAEPGAGVSQDDVDAMLAAGGAPPAEQPAAEPKATDTGGAVKQDDIDALLAGAAEGQAPAGDSPPAADSAPAAEPEEPASQDEGLLSQDVLDKLIADAQSTAEAVEAPSAAEAGPPVAAAAPPPPAQAPAPPPEGAQGMALADLSEEASGEPVASVDLLRDVSMRVKIELGRAKMYVEDVLRLGKGSVVELDKLAGDPVDVFVNDRLIAHGEVLVLNENFCVRISEICAPEKV
jgi:flagellar motor switch protein FliN/FliY